MQDLPRQAEFTFVRACDDARVIQADFSSYLDWCEIHFPEMIILTQHLEII